MARTSCPACTGRALVRFYEQRDVPVHSCLLVDDRQEAIDFPKGSIDLAFCRRCGFIANMAFRSDVHRYSEQYEETQGFSPCFQGFARALAERWIERYDLRRGHVFEIGCGKGEFLRTICELGDNRGTGIDPSYVPSRLDGGDRVRFVQDFYDGRYGTIEADAVICRHTLEHIQPVGEFLGTVRRSIGDRTETVVLFEVPDVRRVLAEAAFWDVYYEHCSYFTLGSLARTFRVAGFEVLDVSVDFDGQYLLIEAVPSTTPAPGHAVDAEDDIAAVADLVAGFGAAVRHEVADWRADLLAARELGKRLAVWGSGSKGVAFLTTIGLVDEIDYVVDVNPFKHGKFMVGTGHPIVGPQSLPSDPPDIVVVMNPIYQQEIQEMLDSLGVSAELVAV